MKKTKVVVHSETEPTFVFGEEGLAEAFRSYGKIKSNYDQAKYRVIMELFWVILLVACIITGKSPFPKEILSISSHYLLYIGVIFWGVCLYGSVRSIVIYISIYAGDETEMFMNELKKQPWR